MRHRAASACYVTLEHGSQPELELERYEEIQGLYTMNRREKEAGGGGGEWSSAWRKIVLVRER